MKLSTLIIVGLTALTLTTAPAMAVSDNNATATPSAEVADQLAGSGDYAVQASSPTKYIRKLKTKVIKYINKNYPGSKKGGRTSNPGGVRGFLAQPEAPTAPERNDGHFGQPTDDLVQASSPTKYIRKLKTKVIKYINKNYPGTKKGGRTSNPGGVRG